VPELPEVEAVTRRVRRMATGARIVSAGLYRAGIAAPQNPEKIRHGTRGQRIEAVERRGKNILVFLDGGSVLRVHLRMTGNLTVIADHRLRPVTARAWFELDDGRAMILDDPRALGRITLHKTAELAKLFSNLGPEPLGPEFTPEFLARIAAASRKPIKLLLMDQRLIAGLGNIYAAEVLFQAGIHPARKACRAGAGRLRALHAAIVGTLKLAIDSAIKAYELPGGFSEEEVFPAAVYGREGEACLRCRNLVRRMKQGGRSTYYCPGCQK
jgi:formamidopyrimidine-DNA glycosylase